MSTDRPMRPGSPDRTERFVRGLYRLLRRAYPRSFRDDPIGALKDRGVEVRLTNYLGAPHGFASFPGATRVGAAARAELVRFLAERLVSRPGGKVV